VEGRGASVSIVTKLSFGRLLPSICVLRNKAISDKDWLPFNSGSDQFLEQCVKYLVSATGIICAAIVERHLSSTTWTL
jgi:hypothetical protein